MAPPLPTQDGELVVLAREGRTDAFAELYNRYFSRVYDFLVRLLRDRQEAADVAQDTFVRAMQHLSDLEKPDRFKSWVFSIAHRRGLNLIERSKRSVATPSVGTDESLNPLLAAVDPDRLSSPEEVAEARDLAEVVWEAAAGLDLRTFEVMDLHVRQGLDSAEIADVMGVSKGNAYTMVSRMKTSVRESLATYLLARKGARDCEDLAELLSEVTVPPVTPEIRRTVERHVKGCNVCEENRKAFLVPLHFVAALAAVPPPTGLQAGIWSQIEAGYVHGSGDAGEDGPGGGAGDVPVGAGAATAAAAVGAGASEVPAAGTTTGTVGAVGEGIPWLAAVAAILAVVGVVGLVAFLATRDDPEVDVLSGGVTTEAPPATAEGTGGTTSPSTTTSTDDDSGTSTTSTSTTDASSSTATTTTTTTTTTISGGSSGGSSSTGSSGASGSGSAGTSGAGSGTTATGTGSGTSGTGSGTSGAGSGTSGTGSGTSGTGTGSGGTAAPTATSDVVTMDEDGTATIDVLANDSTGLDGATLVITAAPLHGTATVSGGVIVYTPALNFAGTDAFSYEASDAEGRIAGATVSLTVAAVNDAPIIPVPPFISVVEDEIASFDPFALVFDFEDDPLTLVAFDPVTSAGGSVTLGSLIYTPPADFNGIDTFEFTVSDGAAETIVEVNMVVEAVNDEPVGDPVPVETPEDTPLVVDILSQYTDADGDELAMVFIDEFVTAAGGTFQLLDDWLIEYTPPPEYSGPDELAFTVTDLTALVPGTLDITVTAVNDAPVVDALTLTLPEDTEVGTVVGKVTASDVEGDPFSFAVGEGPLKVDSETGELTVAEPLDFETAPTFDVTVTATDTGGAQGTGTVSVVVTDTNEAPSVSSATFTVPFDAGVGHEVGTVEASDPDGDPLTYSITDENAFTIDAANGAIFTTEAFTPEISVYEFRVTVIDPGKLAASAVVVVIVGEGAGLPDLTPR